MKGNSISPFLNFVEMGDNKMLGKLQLLRQTLSSETDHDATITIITTVDT